MFKKLRLFAAMAAACALAAPSFVQGMGVTEVSVEGNMASIVIDNAVKISEIKMIQAAGKTVVKYPEYVSRTRKVYPQIKFLNPMAQEICRKAIVTGQPKGVAGVVTFKVGKFSKYNRPGAMKYFCSVIFNNALEVECKIIDSPKGRGPFISWPSYKDESSGQWVKQVEILDKALAKKIDSQLIGRYQKSKGADAGGDEGYGAGGE